jgi:uncharacterized membrane protein YgaE (UPF0421/DUF939 family)
MIVIAICLKMRLESTISVALVTVIAIMEYTDKQFIEFAVLRFATIMLGLFAAFIVNLIFLPPKYEKKLYGQITENTENILKWIRIHIRHASDHHILKEDIEKMKESMTKLEHLYLMYKEERTYSRKNRFQKSRKLVLYRQMIVVANRALDTLKILHRFENELYHMPLECQQAIRSQLDSLLHYHEQLLLKFIEKVKYHPRTETAIETHQERKRLIEAFYTHLQQKNEYYLFSLLGTIIDYSEQLEHLDKLIDSFQHYHHDASLVKNLTSH